MAVATAHCYHVDRTRYFVHRVHEVSPSQHISRWVSRITHCANILIGVECKMLTVDEMIKIIGSDTGMNKALAALPPNLLFDDLVRFLGFPKSTVYKITKMPDFPRLETGIHKLCVPRSLFLDWYYKHLHY